jgi:RNase P subunit RPR2
MTDIDERGQTRPRATLEDPTIVKRLVCPLCHHVTKITRAWRTKIMSKMDPKYPARTEMIECKCGDMQFIVQVSWPKRANGNS